VVCFELGGLRGVGTVQRFQILVVALLLTIVAELAVVLEKLPTTTAEAQLATRPIPIIIAGSKGTDCPEGYACAAVLGSSLSVKDFLSSGRPALK
jgi:hypothetical protein